MLACTGLSTKPLLLFLFLHLCWICIRCGSDTDICSPSITEGVCPAENYSGELGIFGLPYSKHALELCDIHKYFTTTMTRQCLKNKKVVLLGDSTMTETTHDLSILLSGVTNVSDIHAYMRAATRSHSTSLGDSTQILLQPNHRKMTTYESSHNITLQHRFTGHHDITLDFGGIDTFFNSSFSDELRCLLGDIGDGGGGGGGGGVGGVGGRKKCTKPDILIINSGLHDRISSQQYHEKMSQLAKLIRKTQIPRVLYKGSIYIPPHFHTPKDIKGSSLEAYDVSAKYQFELYGMTYMNTSKLMQDIFCQLDANVNKYSPDCLHYGAIAYYHDENLNYAMMTYITQAILNHIC